MRMIQEPKEKKIQPIHCPQHVQIYTNNKNNYNKSQISNIIHQKEKFFVNQVSYKFKYPSFTKKKNPNLFRKKIKIKLSSMPPPSFLTCNWLLASTTKPVCTPDHYLTQLQVPTLLCGVSLSLLRWGFMRVSLKGIFYIILCFLTFESSTSLFGQNLFC